MSQFNFVSDLQNALIMDGETRGPAPRWKKKLEASLNGSANTTRSVLSVSYNTSFSGVQVSTKTPGKTSDGKAKKSATTPSKTPGGGDRFIPNRAATNFELAHFLVSTRSTLIQDFNYKIHLFIFIGQQGYWRQIRRRERKGHH